MSGSKQAKACKALEPVAPKPLHSSNGDLYSFCASISAARETRTPERALKEVGHDALRVHTSPSTSPKKALIPWLRGLLAV